MTENKPIITDGKECRYWFQPNPTDYRKCALRGKDDNCDEIKDCFVKELLCKLALKTQECEKLRTDIKDIANLLDLDTGEEYNFGNIEISIKDLKQECEELKKQHKSDKGLITSTGKQNYQLIQEYDKLKKCLTEIEEIAEPFCNACQEFEPEKKCSNCIYCNYGEILQKISECEVEDEK